MPRPAGEDIYQAILEEHDHDKSAKRVIPVSASGRSVAYEDTSFVTGDSPAVHDVNTDLVRNGKDGYIVNDGSGDFTVEISDNGTNYGGIHTIKNGEIMQLTGLDINKIRITWVANSAYRIFVI